MTVKNESKILTPNEVERVTKHCLKLLSCTEYLRRDAAVGEAHTFAENILKSMRKLYIASMMQDKHVICVSGLQGVGKTTLMKNFYGLDETYLGDTLDRGERIPILITDKENVSEPSMYAVKIEKVNGDTYDRSEVKLSADEFKAACSGSDPNVMYLELHVPYRHTFNEAISFMLLPGFERKNDYWNDLIEFSVNSSDTAVFVFNGTSFANANNEKYLKMIKENFGENIVYAISSSDMSSDGNAEVKQTCIKVLGIDSEQADRVVCTGLYTDVKKNEEWIEHFGAALRKYSYQGDGFLQAQNNSKYVYEEIEKIKDDLYKIQHILDDDSTAEIRDHHNDTLLKEFDKAVKKKRKEFEKILDEKFAAANNKSVERLEVLFKERPKLNEVKKMLIGAGVADLSAAKEMVKKSFYSTDGENLPGTHLSSALSDSLKSFENPEERIYLRELIDTKKEGEKTKLVAEGEKSRALVADVKYLLEDNSQNKEKDYLATKNSKKVFGAIAELGTYYYSLYSYNEIAEKTNKAYYEPATSIIKLDDIKQGAESSKRFAVGIAGMMGVDLIGDGSINMVSQIAASLGAPVAAVGAIAVAIGGVGAATVVLRDINRMQREDFMSARLAVSDIYDNMKCDTLEKYDSYMEKIRDRLEDNITELGVGGKKITVEHNAKIAVNNALDILDEISNRFAGDAYGLGTFNS